MNHDYKKIDAKRQYHWRQERLEAVQALGYQYISEFIVETYRSTKSGRKTGIIHGGMTGNGIRAFLKSIGEPLAGPGGFRPGDRRCGQKLKFK